MDGVRIATCGSSKAKIWRAKLSTGSNQDQSSEPVFSLKSDPSRVNRHKEGEYVCRIAWNHSYKVLATGGTRGTVLLIAVDTDAKLSPFYHGETITALKFSSSSRYLCAASASKVTLWDLKTKKTDPLLECNIPAPATTVDFDANQRRLIVCLQNGILCMWDIRDISRFVEKKISEGSSEDVYTPVEIEGAQPFINACFFQKQQLPMKNWLITAEKDGSVRIWDVSTDPWQEVWEVPESGVHSQDIGTIFLSSQSPDDLPETPESEDMLIAGPGVFASASTDGTINVFDGQHQRHMFQFKLDVSITCMDFFPDGYKLVVGDSTSTLQVLDTRSTAPVAIVSTDEVPLQVLVQHRINQTKMEDKREKMKSTTSDAIQRPGTIDDVSHRGKATQNSIEREENGHKNLSSHARTPPQPPIAVSSSEPGSQNSTVWPAPVSPIDHESSHLAERVSNLENSLADTVKQTISQTFETYMRTVDRKIESALERSADRQASSQGGSPSHPNSNQANDNISDQHLQQLIQKQVETAVSKSIEPISQKLQNMHLEILRQGHTMKREVSSLLQEYQEQLKSIYDENERLRKENEDLKRFY